MTNTAFELDLNDEQAQNFLQLGDFEDIFATWIDGNLKIEDTYDAVMQEFIEDYDYNSKEQNYTELLNNNFYHFEDIYDAEYNELL